MDRISLAAVFFNGMLFISTASVCLMLVALCMVAEH